MSPQDYLESERSLAHDLALIRAALEAAAKECMLCEDQQARDRTRRNLATAIRAISPESILEKARGK